MKGFIVFPGRKMSVPEQPSLARKASRNRRIGQKEFEDGNNCPSNCYHSLLFASNVTGELHTCKSRVIYIECYRGVAHM